MAQGRVDSTDTSDAAPAEVPESSLDEETLKALADYRSAGTRNGHLIRHRLERRSPWGRILRGIAALLAVAALLQEGAALYLDHQLTEAARIVTGQEDVEVNCRRIWDEAIHFKPNPGFVMWGSSTANLQLPVCYSAWRWAGSPDDEGTRLGLMILTHELAHVVGHFDESQTECVAMWAAPRTAVALGGTQEEGQRAASWYAAEYNPLLRSEYRAPGCLAGPKPTSRLVW